MSEDTMAQATSILRALRDGDAAAAEDLLPLVYSELRHLAGDMFKHQRPDHTLQPTELVHMAYVNLIKQKNAGWKDQAHFVAVAAKAMRNLLIDHARKRHAAKRGHDWDRVTLDGILDSAAKRSVDLLSLERALQELATLNERMVQVVELRFFGGLSISETAEALGISKSAVDEDWAMARAWLSRRLAPKHN